MQKFEQGNIIIEDKEAFIEKWSSAGFTREQAEYQYRRLLEDDVYINDKYQVNISWVEPSGFGFDVTHLSIKLRTKEPVHDWRELQQIKNELCGEEREAMEIYPAESRRVDTSNQYHLWVMPEGVKIPVGFIERLVSEDEGLGNKQRKFED
jgi:hypothetical protein